MTAKPIIATYGELKQSGYQPKNIKDELRQNLLSKLRKKENAFPGIHGFEHTVIPELERAILSRHNINLLGLRGQAKTRLARQMTELLDEWIPIIAGSEINDDPFSPISIFAKQLLAEKGDDTPIDWVHRSERYFEKLATPDVTVADLIGDIDPIKAANLRLSYADSRVIHFGMIPRANRSIFVLNELPDLQARIQVALFNILQEGDVQIRGFNLRLPLDIQFVFTANPEDYTNRGSIVTPLKDRIGSQIITHYPLDVDTAKAITRQEMKVSPELLNRIHIPELARDLLEQIAFEARKSEYIDEKSGVSARLSITAMENLLSAAERRMALSGDDETTIRMQDFMGVIPAITGKVELVYEGEQEGAMVVAENLIGAAVRTIFPTLFPKIEKLKRSDEQNPYQGILNWFGQGNELEVSENLTNEEYKKSLDKVEPLVRTVKRFQKVEGRELLYFSEFLLWGLAEFSQLNKAPLDEGVAFSDLFNAYISQSLRGDEEV